MMTNQRVSVKRFGLDLALVRPEVYYRSESWYYDSDIRIC
jgi:hypothetical protein